MYCLIYTYNIIKIKLFCKAEAKMHNNHNVKFDIMLESITMKSHSIFLLNIAILNGFVNDRPLNHLFTIER